MQIFKAVLTTVLISIAESSFQITSLNVSLSNSYTLVQNVAYDLNLSMPSQQIASSSTVGLAFSSRYSITSSTLSNCRASTSSSVPPIAISSSSCTVAYFSASQIYQITMVGVFAVTSTYSYLRLQFTINNPYGQAAEPINISIADSSSNILGSGTSYTPTYQPSLMTGCSITSSSQFTSANSTHTYTFTPVQMMIAQSYLLITMPPWYGSTGNDATSPIVCTGIQGTDLPSLSCNAQTPLTTQTLNVTNGLVSANKTANTISFNITQMRNPWSLQPFGPISIQLMYGQSLSQLCASTYITVSSPSSLLSTSFTISNLNISTTNNNVRLTFFPTNVFPTSSPNRVQIQFSSALTINYVGSMSIYSSSSTQITLQNVTVYSISNFTVVSPPSTRPFNFIVTTYYVESGTGYAIQTRTTNTVQCVAGTISSVSATATINDVNTITSYTIIFTIKNRLISGSFINIVFPQQLSIQVGSASCSLSGHTCSVISSSNITISITSLISASTSLTATITNVLNAGQALTTTSFAIYTYYDTLYDSLVDFISTGITVTMKPKSITSATVSPISFITNTITNYQFTLTLNNPILTNGYILIKLPTTVTFTNSSNLLSATFSTTTCSSSMPDNKTINITNCFTTKMTTLPLTLTISNVLNPPSFAPTSTFQFYTFGTTGYLIDYRNTSLTTAMNVAATTTTFTVSPANSVVGNTVTYTFTIAHAIPIHVATDYAIITIPTLMTVPASPACTPISGITTVTCSQKTTTQLRATYSTAPSQTISFSLSLQNYLISTQTVSYSLSVYDSNNYLMETYASQTLSYTQATLTSVAVNNDSNIAVNQLSNITLTITNGFSLYNSLSTSLTQLLITIPVGFTIGSACTSATGTCSVFNTTTYKVTNVGYTLNTYTVVLTNVLLNSFSPTSASFVISYSYNGNKVSSKYTGIVVPVYCTLPCQRCSTSVTACMSCLPAPNTLIYYDSAQLSCGSSCISGKYADTNNNCQPCVAPCSTCYNQSDCKSCVANNWLYLTTCSPVCPNTYYNASDGTCKQCQTPCQNCKNNSYCMSCAVGYFYNNWCVNASACPAGTYANSTTMVCQSCTHPCSACSLSPTNCTSCASPYLYYSNLCVLTCPPGMYPTSTNCLPCTGLCATCSNSTFCNSCTSNFLYNGSCVTSANCPAGTYANTSTLACEPCTSPCSSCSLEPTNCTSCIPGYLYYSNKCVSSCPALMYAASPNCLNCISPCANCTNTTFCLSCSINYFYNNTCVSSSSCPAGTYANTTALTCAICQSPCSSCSQAPTNCTSCIPTYYYFNNTCVSSCPSLMYALNNSCVNCVGTCANCVNATFCLTCIGGLYYYNGTCVTASACPSSTYPNATTSKCETCPGLCSLCSNQTYCTSCSNPYLLYNFYCYSSCPAGSYQPQTSPATLSCTPCTAPCSTCANTSTNCLSCVSPKLYYNGGCVDSCGAGTYTNGNQCSNCLATCSTCSAANTCDSCTGSRYLQNGQCGTSCNTGTYADTNTNTCTNCTPPCSTCVNSSTSCTACTTGNNLFNNTCSSSCPSNYFPVSGVCVTCGNCVNCINAYTCQTCKPGYYMYVGVCYSSCPYAAPIADDSTFTCTVCDSNCMNCESTAKNCTACYGGQFLYKGACMSTCPAGLTADTTTATCKQMLNNSNIYLPFSFLYLFLALVCIASKCYHSQTQIITALAAFVSLCQFASWCLLAYIITVNTYLVTTIINVVQYVCLAVIVLSIGVGLSYNIAICKQYQDDKGIAAWKQYDKTCVYSYRIVNILSALSFRFFRLLYSKLFNRIVLSMYVADGARLLNSTSKLTYATLVMNTLPMMAICAIILYKAEQVDQTFFCAIDTLILGFCSAVLLTIDSNKNSQEYFDSVKNQLPFLKYRNMKNDDSLVSLGGENLLSMNEQKNGDVHSEIDKQQQKNKIFTKINWLPNLNKYGHLNVLQEQKDDKNQVLSLPEHNKIGEYPTYSFDQQFDAINQTQIGKSGRNKTDNSRVIDDELYFIQKQDEQRKIQQEEERKRIQKQEEQRKKQEQRKLQEQLRQRRQFERRQKQLLEQQQRQRVDLQFTDLTAIDKVQAKYNRNKKSPLDLLSNCKKANDKLIDEKSLKKLQEMGKKNGIDPQFMKETFGVQKNHNPYLLNSIIDKHNHVKRQSIKQLFNKESSNPQVLQQLFGKNSKTDPQKLRQILNDPKSEKLIQKMVDKQKGILSPQMCKQLFDEKGNYSKQFITNLLSEENGMDQQKLKALLKNSDAKGKQSPLKSLKKVGGQNLQKKQILGNMLGKQATLNPQNFTKVANQLSAKAIQNIFQNKKVNSNLLSSKILNNKKINLKNLAPILQDEQLIHELAENLAQGQPNFQQNILNLFKNADNIDPVKLRQMLADPIIRQKLLTKQVDPSFLQAILDKNSNSDLNILRQTLKQMPDQLIAQTFKFDPQRNTDFKNLAQLFDANPKTDPVLVSKMLEPSMVKKIYAKGNDTKMVKKLVQKGNQFDPQVIKNVYGDHRKNIFDTIPFHTLDQQKYTQKQDEFRSQKDYHIDRKKNSLSQANMSRTAGGTGNFSNSIVPISNREKIRPSNFKVISNDEWSLHGDGQVDDYDQDENAQEDISQKDESEQTLEGQTKKRRVKKPAKKVKQKLVDVRHPAQQIYLQRIQAPHQYAMRKANIRKKKKKQLTPLVMDEDNDIFDMDF